MICAQDRQMAIELIVEAVTQGARYELACEILGIHSRTYRRWQAQMKQRGKCEDGRIEAATCREYANALSGEERQQIIDICLSEEYVHLPPTQIVPLLADKGIYIASESTFYRLLRQEKLVRQKVIGNRASTSRAIPRLIARAPNEVWSWDITYLPTQIKGEYVKLYMIVDMYSRLITGWEIHLDERAEHAAKLIELTAMKEKIPHAQLILHADNGSPMKGFTMLAKLAQLGISHSFNRPATSNDNAYSESLFGSLKTRKQYPRKGFASLEVAREWVLEFVRWYNTEHKHSGIGFVTPAERHEGLDKAILIKRKAVYQAAKAKHPTRWKGREVRNCDPITTVSLNPITEPNLAS